MAEVNAHLTQLGLTTCPVCGSEGLSTDRRPAIVRIGGFHHEPGDPRRDPEANVLFMVRVECQLCGHAMLFNSERYRTGDEPILIKGPLESEDEIDPPDLV